MLIQLLYFDGCPNWQVAQAHLREALDQVGRPAEIETVLVSTPEEAEARGLRGSPSVLIDGRDPFEAASPGAPVGLFCRLYRTPDGVSGSPTVGQFLDVLTS